METKHDEIRRIMHEHGFRFKDSERTALDMTDEEVEKFLVEFAARFVELGTQLAESFNQLLVIVTRASEPIRDLGKMLAEAERSS